MRFAIRFAKHHLGADPALYGTHARLTILKDTASPKSSGPKSSGPKSSGPKSSGADAQTLALNALGWILGDEDRAERFLSLTGLTPDALRASLGQPGTLRAVLDHLCAHEPDLIAAAQALGVAPEQLAHARKGLT